mmetsp:Transcript_1544/g.2854  ORF Transcript_1544/g.2854 Transcript_1544/m.2854 type:complete len:208 (+) Transcript_1544:1135-1758(+)
MSPTCNASFAIESAGRWLCRSGSHSCDNAAGDCTSGVPDVGGGVQSMCSSIGGGGGMRLSDDCGKRGGRDDAACSATGWNLISTQSPSMSLLLVKTCGGMRMGFVESDSSDKGLFLLRSGRSGSPGFEQCDVEGCTCSPLLPHRLSKLATIFSEGFPLQAPGISLDNCVRAVVGTTIAGGLTVCCTVMRWESLRGRICSVGNCTLLK